mgnify:CR=1 FL=1
MQVTRQLAALCIQAHQQKTTVSIRYLITSVLGLWLHMTAYDKVASPGSRLAASLQQQLQGPGLQQHMAAMLTDAADGLTAAAAAAFGEHASSSTSSSGGGGSNSLATAASESRNFQLALAFADRVVSIYIRGCEVLSPGDSRLTVALPAAPAAVRLILTILQTCSKLHQLINREGSPAAVLLLGIDAVFEKECTSNLGTAYWAILDLADAMQCCSPDSPLQSLPGARELLLCPELVPCLAAAVLVAVLGLDTALEGSSSGVGGVTGAARAAGSSSSGGTQSGSSKARGRQHAPATAKGSLQQPTAAAGSSTGRSQAGRSSSSSIAGRCGKALDLNSLTPLSSGLLGMLGVEQDVLLRAARGAGSTFQTINCIGAYNIAIEYQVSGPPTAC